MTSQAQVLENWARTKGLELTKEEILKLLKQLKEAGNNNTDNSTSAYNIKSPYIILIAASTYDKLDLKDLSDEEKEEFTTYNDLPGTKKVIKELYNIFTNKNLYNYNKKNISLNIDELNIKNKRYPGIIGDKLGKLFRYHADIIEDLNEDDDKTKHIDSLIFIYSGHGVSNGIVPTDAVKGGQVYPFEEVFKSFANNAFAPLRNLIKLYIIDACRGPKSIANHMGDNESTIYLPKIDEVRWFGTIDNYKSFEEKKSNGTVMGNALCQVMRDNANNGFSYVLQTHMASRVQKIVSESKVQVPVFKQFITVDEIYFRRSDFKDKLPVSKV